MTAQIGDSLVFEGRSFSLGCEPLYPWLARKRNRDLRFRIVNTGCWRGYRSNWEVRGGRLFLTAFKARLSNGRFAGIPTLFKAYSPQFIEASGLHDYSAGRREVFAFWVTGAVRCIFGLCVDYFHGGYESRYEGELFLHFQDGYLIGQHIVHNPFPLPARCPPLDELFTASELQELAVEQDLLSRRRGSRADGAPPVSGAP